MKTLVSSLVLAAVLAAAIAPAQAAPSATAERRIAIAVTSKGFEPAAVHVKKGQPLRLVVTRKTERTCATDIVLKGYGIKKALPLNREVEVRLTPRRSGAIRYACAMDMIAGQLVVD